jgi:arylsulfatase A-like enzyme
MFEGGFRVPCIARWPGVIPAGQVVDGFATAMDLLPTFAHIAGVEPPSDRALDGSDIWPMIVGAPAAASPRETFLYYGGRRLWGIRSGSWKLLFERECADDEDLRCTGSVLRRALFDLSADVGESDDLAESRPEVADRLLELAEALDRELWRSRTTPVPDEP